MSYLPIILSATGGIILTIGDIIMKKWVTNNLTRFFIFGMLVWIVGLSFLAQSFKYKNIAIASTIFVIFNVAALSLVSWFYFKEKLSLLEMGGIFLGIASIITLESASK